jgi:hypothetical protein
MSSELGNGGGNDSSKRDGKLRKGKGEGFEDAGRQEVTEIWDWRKMIWRRNLEGSRRTSPSRTIQCFPLSDFLYFSIKQLSLASPPSDPPAIWACYNSPSSLVLAHIYQISHPRASKKPQKYEDTKHHNVMGRLPNFRQFPLLSYHN